VRLFTGVPYPAGSPRTPRFSRGYPYRATDARQVAGKLAVDKCLQADIPSVTTWDFRKSHGTVGGLLKDSEYYKRGKSRRGVCCGSSIELYHSRSSGVLARQQELCNRTWVRVVRVAPCQFLRAICSIPLVRNSEIRRETLVPRCQQKIPTKRVSPIYRTRAIHAKILVRTCRRRWSEQPDPGDRLGNGQGNARGRSPRPAYTIVRATVRNYLAGKIEQWFFQTEGYVRRCFIVNATEVPQRRTNSWNKLPLGVCRHDGIRTRSLLGPLASARHAHR